MKTLWLDGPSGLVCDFNGYHALVYPLTPTLWRWEVRLQGILLWAGTSFGSDPACDAAYEMMRDE